MIVAIVGLVTQTTLADIGASVPWKSYEAENMTTTGYVVGPEYQAGLFGTEASGRRLVYMDTTGQYAEFSVLSPANRMVVRYCVPDAVNGGDADYTLSLYTNGVFAQKLFLTSKYTWLYGTYPFSNNPSAGTARNYFDELRLTNLAFAAGETVRVQKAADDSAFYYVIDLIDLEYDTNAIVQPANSFSATAYGADGSGTNDSTTALGNCISAAKTQGKSVWVPAGTYKITGTVNLPAGVTIQGAGIWNTTFIGDPALYSDSSRRVTFNGNGSNIHLSDFAILGRLTYRNDSEHNDGLGGSFGIGSTISRVWVEHTKTGAWLVNSSGLVVDGCRFRDTIADGINLCVGMRGCVVTNCTARSTGDDCFAIWPATYTSQNFTPGLNVFTHCTGQLPFLANGCAIYGGISNRADNCRMQDICYASGVLISTTFPVGLNVFQGVTSVRDSEIVRSGGKDPYGDWRAAFLLFLDNSSLSGVNVSNVNIRDNLCDGFDVIAPGSSSASGLGTLSNATISRVTITNYGLANFSSDALWADYSAIGALTVSNCDLAEFGNYSPNFTFHFFNDAISAHAQPPYVYQDGSASVASDVTVGFPYHLERKENIAATNWQTIDGSQVTAYRTPIYLFDPGTNQVPARYYRVVSP